MKLYSVAAAALLYAVLVSPPSVSAQSSTGYVDFHRYDEHEGCYKDNEYDRALPHDYIQVSVSLIFHNSKVFQARLFSEIET